jgi:HEAT repeat protein
MVGKMKYFKSLVLFVFLVSITSCHGGAHVNQHDISGEIDSPTTSVHSLIQSLESDSNGELRNTIKNLRLMGGEAKSAIPKLLEIMSDPPRYSSKVQMEAMLAVANIAPENKEVVNSLLLKLGHRDEEIRKKALEAIYNTGAKDPSIINAIEQLSKEDHSRMVRKVAQDYYRSLKLQTLVESRE